MNIRTYLSLFFQKIAKWVSNFVGSPLAFSLAVALIVGWAVWAYPRHFDSDSQMPINSITTIITFLMVFLIQNSQNRESRAVHIKLDELIRADQNARNPMMKAEKLSDEDVKAIEEEFEKACEERGDC